MRGPNIIADTRRGHQTLASYKHNSTMHVQSATAAAVQMATAAYQQRERQLQQRLDQVTRTHALTHSLTLYLAHFTHSGTLPPTHSCMHVLTYTHYALSSYAISSETTHEPISHSHSLPTRNPIQPLLRDCQATEELTNAKADAEGLRARLQQSEVCITLCHN